ncbi:hypothetical protein C0989_008655 [Termitomyces sp. Mn162]|nr:hypothetical protein C0989_008655 [Termitomyces sp. Mn162]
MDGHAFSNFSSAFFSNLSGTGGAPARALAHCYLTLGTVYFGVVLLELCEPKDYVLLAQTGDGKDYMLHVILITEDEIDHRANSACFVGHSIEVEDQNVLGKWLHDQAMALDKLQVQEQFCHSAI